MYDFLDFCSRTTFNHRPLSVYHAWARRFQQALLDGKLDHRITPANKRSLLLATYRILRITQVPLWVINLPTE